MIEINHPYHNQLLHHGHSRPRLSSLQATLWLLSSYELALRSTIEQPTSNLAVLQERAMPGFQFNLATIATAIELGKRVGFRAASDAMDTFRKEERVMWMVDHSSQIGKERLLLIVGVALDDLPPPGQTLTFDKLKVLAMVPGQSWWTLPSLPCRSWADSQSSTIISHRSLSFTSAGVLRALANP